MPKNKKTINDKRIPPLLRLNTMSFTSNLKSITRILMRLRSFLFLSVATISALVFFSRCLPPNQGCTDVNATNFNVTASKQILPNNCVYPKLVLQFYPYWDTTALSTSNIYGTTKGDTFKILNAQFYFSSVNLLDANQKSVAISDSILMYRAKDSINIPLNILLNSITTKEYSLFSISTAENYTHLLFNTGLDATSQQAAPSRNVSGNPLATQSFSIYDTTNSKYYFQSITISRLSKGDTITVYGQQTIPFDFTNTAASQKGFSIAFRFKVDYKKLLANVPTFNADSATLQKQVWSNIQNSISLLQK